MTVEMVMGWLQQYGAFAIFVIVLLEYMNLPGFPAGIIMPMAGVWAHYGGISFLAVLFITEIAGLLGSWILYFLGYFLGAPLLDKWEEKFPKHRASIDRALTFLRERGCWGLFVAKLLPMFRTLIPVPAGVIRMDFWRYTLYSAMGVFVWNLVLVGAGFFVGQSVLPELARIM